MAIMDIGQSSKTAGLLAAKFRELLDHYSEARKRRRQIAALRSLSPGALKDIGIDRSEICSIVHGIGRDASRINRS